MPSRKNRHSQKGNESEDRTGNNTQNNSGYLKLSVNTANDPGKRLSTADDPSNGKYSRTDKRKEEKNNEGIQGGR